MALEIEFEGESLEIALKKACKFFGTDINSIEYKLVSEQEETSQEEKEKRVKIAAKQKLDIVSSPEAKPEQARAIEVPQDVKDDSLSQKQKQDKVIDFLQKIISLTKLDLKLKSRQESNQIIVDLYGPDKSFLIDNKGQLLTSLQYLLSKTISSDKGFTWKISLDCDGYRKLREKELCDIARKGASIAKRNGREYLLGYMNPYERRVIHVTLKNDPTVTTKSLGDRFIKRIAIVPNKKAQDRAKKEV